MTQYGLTLDPHRIVSTLSVGERQRIEIVRALLLNPRLLIMDEPTSVLTPQEVEQLFVVLRKLAQEGCSILYISHKLHEIKALCDTATILRGGKVVDTCDPKVETSRSMAEKMIGGNLKDIVKADGRDASASRAFVVSHLSLPAAGHFGTSLEDISFSVRAGEIFGIAGVAGNGQNELLLALDGEVASATAARSPSTAGRSANCDTSGRRRLRACARVPEERNGHAAVPRLHARRQHRAHRPRPAAAWCSGGLIRPRRGKDLYRRGDRRLRGQGAGAGRDGGVALGRQPAEVHHGPRDPAEAGACWWSASRPGASMRAPRRPSTRRWSTSRRRGRRSWSSARTSTSC